MNLICRLNITTIKTDRDDNSIPFSKTIGHSCPGLINVISPYIIAMNDGIQFPWEKMDDGAKVTCPAGHLDVRIDRPKNGVVWINVINNYC
jgi:uncharacterized repeat protein (TIGR04076 family)